SPPSMRIFLPSGNCKSVQSPCPTSRKCTFNSPSVHSDGGSPSPLPSGRVKPSSHAANSNRQEDATDKSANKIAAKRDLLFLWYFFKFSPSVLPPAGCGVGQETAFPTGNQYISVI